MITLTPEEFSQRYGEESLAQFPTSIPEQPSFLERVKQTAQSGMQMGQESYGKYLESPDKTLGGGIRAGAGLAAGVSRAVASPILEAPGFKQVGEAFGKTGEFIESKVLGGKPSDLLSKLPEGVLETTSNIAETAVNVAALEGTTQQVRALPGQIRAGVSKVKGMTPPAGQAFQKMAQATGNQSPQIMNRVARLKPTDANNFQRLSGKTHGEYLSETGNFGTPDKIVANEAQKFTQSRLDVDNALSQLPGEYKVGALKDALKELVIKAKSESSKNVKAPYLDKTMEFANKYNKQGLTMSEINEVKRLYERHVKLGYNKLMNAEKVQRATNVDNALREWQVKQASELGFKNIKEMNKQTQLSKFMVDKLGAQITGKTGLNEVSLTDWIMLSGGDPTAIGGFLTKKFLSSNAVQAKIAQMLKQGEAAPPVKPSLNGGYTKPQSPLLPGKGLKKAPSSNTTPSQINKASIKNDTAPTNKTSNRIIEQSVPQKKGLIQRMVDRYKNTPNKQGGFINVGEPLSTSGPRFEPRIQEIVSKMAEQNLGGAKYWPESVAKRLRGELRDKSVSLKESDLNKTKRTGFYTDFLDKKLNEVVPRNKSLTGKEAKIQEASIEKYTKNRESLMKEYQDKNGKVVNADEAKKLFADVGYSGINSAAVHEASSALVKDVWKKLLKSSRSEDAVITVGGSGTGKSTAVNNYLPNEVQKAGAIFDGNLSTLKTAKARIQEAIDAGMHPTLVYVYREIADSWKNGVIKRMLINPEEGGRVVPLSVFLENHKGSYNVVKTLLDDSELGKSFDIKMVDNSLGEGRQQLLDRSKFDSINYEGNLRDKLVAETKELYDEGTITKEQYEALIK